MRWINQLPVAMLLIVFYLCSASVYAKPTQTHCFSVTKNVVWASPDSFNLTMDIYVPQTSKLSYPVVIIYHGGGWLINQKEIMDSMAVYLASHAEYVICNVNYRLLGDKNNTIKMNQIIEDALGAVVWVKEHIKAYNGDSSRITVTGDSAGGHLASMVVLCGNKLSPKGFYGDTLGFNPTYLPANTTATDLMKKGGINVQAAILSYPALDLHKSCSKGFESAANIFWLMAKVKSRSILGDTLSPKTNPDYYKAISPIYNVPFKSQRQLPPQLCIVGSRDIITPPASIKQYVGKCILLEQNIEFWEYKGHNHAFLDSKKEPLMGNEFTRDAPEPLDRMILFLNKLFY